MPELMERPTVNPTTNGRGFRASLNSFRPRYQRAGAVVEDAPAQPPTEAEPLAPAQALAFWEAERDKEARTVTHYARAFYGTTFDPATYAYRAAYGDAVARYEHAVDMVRALGGRARPI